MSDRRAPKLKAFSVHIFTALGAVCALMALRLAIEQRIEAAVAWLGVALIVDGVDGYFARRFEVKTVLPQVSGEVLDLCVDYVTYVFVPALILLLAGRIEGNWGLVLAGLICVTSLYHFADMGSKTDDHSFVGFPAIWNIVAFYIFALELQGWAASGLILLCAMLTFVPMKWVHPMRVRAWRGITLAATGAWAVAAVAILWAGFPAGPLSGTVIVLVAIYGIGLSLASGTVRRGSGG